MDNVAYDTPEKRRIFFVRYAKVKGFDPLAADNWYSVFASHIPSAKVFSLFFSLFSFLFSCSLSFFLFTCNKVVLGYHGNSLSRALKELFPDIGIDNSKFITQQGTLF